MKLCVYSNNKTGCIDITKEELSKFCESTCGIMTIKQIDEMLKLQSQLLNGEKVKRGIFTWSLRHE